MEAELIFTHPNVRGGTPLTVTTGADMIRWSYTLNTANWPTYGGEVVQILSVAIDDVNIQGTCRDYAQMENIYSYFLEYVQIATQGKGNNPNAGTTSYNQKPMILSYPMRDWTMKIIPHSLPEFRKGRDVVAPEWRLTAYMVDDSYDVAELQDLVRLGYSIYGEAFDLTGGIGYSSANPFSDPFPDGKAQEFDPTQTRAAWQQVGDYYNKIIPSWLSGNFDDLTSMFGASPAFLKWGTPPKSDTSSTDARHQLDQQLHRHSQGHK